MIHHVPPEDNKSTHMGLCHFSRLNHDTRNNPPGAMKINWLSRDWRQIFHSKAKSQSICQRESLKSRTFRVSLRRLSERRRSTWPLSWMQLMNAKARSFCYGIAGLGRTESHQGHHHSSTRRRTSIKVYQTQQSTFIHLNPPFSHFPLPLFLTATSPRSIIKIFAHHRANRRIDNIKNSA